MSDKVDPEMVTLAETIIGRLSADFDPSEFRDSYQDALRELVEQKVNGQKPTPRHIAQPSSNVVDLMAALKRSLEGVLPLLV